MKKNDQNKLIISNIDTGLNNDEVLNLTEKGFLNIDVSPKPKKIVDIFKANFFTLFNLINLILAIMILFTGSLRNLTFMIVVLSNSLISIFQELRARKATEKLKLMTSKTATVIRNSKENIINITEIVLGDIIKCSCGCQVPADCEVLHGECEVNESLLTGEPDMIEKLPGNKLLSGSFVVSGDVIVRAIKVGKDTFSASISKNLKNIEIAKSEIMIAVKKIVKLVSVIILPVGIPLFLNQLKANSFNYSPAALNTSAALIGMIPEGLALLTSSVLALGATKLAKKKILAKDIYSVETLARINTICFDKTGTITEGKFEVVGLLTPDAFIKSSDYKIIETPLKIENISDLEEKKLVNALVILASSLKDKNETIKAVKSVFYKKEFDKEPGSFVPFSSARKFSAVSFSQSESFIIGAIECIFKNNIPNTNKNLKELLKPYENFRILAIANTKNKVSKDNIPSDVNLLGIILLKDKIRKNIKKILNFFYKNEVDIKIISGDNLESVLKIAKTIELKNNKKTEITAVDAHELKTFSDIANAAIKFDIFARVTPQQKREIIKALKIKGKKVAMTGDGVNDVLALKEADCSIALASGSDAAKEISHFILMNEDFSSIPIAVEQGRMAINNIRTTSSLFLVKTIYSIILAALILVFAFPYPFVPIQMSLISTLTIGIPSFLLAFEKNTQKIKDSLFSDIITTASPAAIVICINLIFCFILKFFLHLTRDVYSGISVLTTGIIGILILRKIMKPMNAYRKIIFFSVTILFLVSVFFYGNSFLIKSPLNWASS